MWIWHAAVVGEYQKPLALLGECPNLDMTLLVPHRWPERASQMVHAERPLSGNYRFIKARTIFTGFYYVYFYPSLFYHLLRARPDIIYCYEEAHTFLSALILAFRRQFMPGAQVLLYAAQNIKKRYPPPFRLFEHYSFRQADAILACGTRVAQTLRSKGYQGELRLVPLPTDAQAFSPDAGMREACRREMGLPSDALAIGYAGKLVEEKGLRTLWKAFARLAHECSNVHLVVAGGGPLKSELQERAASAGLEGRLHMVGVVHNTGLPRYMNALDVFVLPSETRSNWREQFGRVIVEAMSCGVPVVGSDSGEIPNVLDDVGLVFPEGDSHALAAHLRNLVADHSLRARLSHAGRERVLNLFSTEKVAAQHYTIYEEMVARR